MSARSPRSRLRGVSLVISPQLPLPSLIVLSMDRRDSIALARSVCFSSTKVDMLLSVLNRWLIQRLLAMHSMAAIWPLDLQVENLLRARAMGQKWQRL